MVVHFYINTPFPYGMAAAKRRLCYAEGLMSQGHIVDVIVCQKCFEKDKDDGLRAQGKYNGINYTYVCGKYKRGPRNKLMRGIDYYVLDYFRSFYFALKHIQRNEIVFVYFYPILLQLLIILASKLKGARVVKETCEHPSALGNVNSYWHKFCKWFEYHFVMPQYDGFIVISRALSDFVLKYKNSRAQYIIVPILVMPSNVKQSDEKNEYSVPYIIHTGTMQEQKDSISKILHAFARFKHESGSSCKLVFTGPQANEKCEYIPMIKELGIENSVDLLGLVSIERVTQLQRNASMTIIYKSDNLQTRNCFPTKLGEMLINGVPVITTTVGDANIYLENGISALIFEPDEDDKLIKNIRYIIDNPDAARKIGLAGKAVAEKYFNPIFQGKRLSDFFKSL